MISNPNPFGISFPSGVLKISPLKATINDGVILLNFCTPFCKVRFGGGLQETVPDKQHGRSPVWNQELSFRRKDENSFKIELCNPNLMFSPSVIGECFINLDLVFAQRQAKIRSELTSNGKQTGSIEVSIKWEPDSVIPTYQSYQSFPERSNPFSTNPHPPVYVQPHGQVFVHQNSFPFGNSGQSPVYVQSVPMNFSGGTTFISYPEPQQQQQQNNFRPMSAQPSYLPSQHIPQNQNQQQANSYNAGVLMGLNQGQQIISQEEAKEAEEPIDPDLPDEKKCVVCLERKKAGAFYRCGHNCCCWTCGKKFIGNPCPLCRQTVLDFIKVYDA